MGCRSDCFGDHVEERLKVLVLVENLSAGIVPVEHVIAVTSGRPRDVRGMMRVQDHGRTTSGPHLPFYPDPWENYQRPPFGHSNSATWLILSR